MRSAPATRAAGSPGRHAQGKVRLGGALHRGDDLQHREAAAIAAVQHDALADLPQIAERIEVSVDEIADMAPSAVSAATLVRWVRAGRLSAPHFGVSDCDIEIAQGHIAQDVRPGMSRSIVSVISFELP